MRLLRSAIGVGWVALAAVGCGSGESGGGDAATADADAAGGRVITEDFVSGARLKARYFDAGGAARTFISWVDTSPAGGGLPCWFLPLTDGSNRCVPGGAEVLYRDAACASPVAVREANQPDLGFALRYSMPECDSEHYVYEGVGVGDVVTADRLFRMYDGRCVDLGPPAATTEVRALLEPITLDDFVAAEIVKEPRGARLSVEVEVSADGARRVRSTYDNDTGDECHAFALVPGGPELCIPRTSAFYYHEGQRYEDPACSIEAAHGPKMPGHCDPPPVILEYIAPTGDQCSGEYRLRMTGEALPAVYGGEACASVPLEGESHGYFHVGDVIPTAQFTPLATALVGDGALRLRATTTPEGERLVTGADYLVFVDAGTEEPCRTYEFTDAVLRCVPTTASIRGIIGSEPELYADAECTRRIVGYDPGRCNDSPPAYIVVQSETVGALGNVVAEVRPVLDEEVTTEGFVYSKTGAGGECAVYPYGGLYPAWRVLGDPIDPSRFPAVSVSVDP